MSKSDAALTHRRIDDTQRQVVQSYNNPMSADQRIKEGRRRSTRAEDRFRSSWVSLIVHNLDNQWHVALSAQAGPRPFSSPALGTFLSGADSLQRIQQLPRDD